MADPTLKRTSVQINYTASDGYRAEVGYSNARSGTPESVFIEAMDELSRLCHLFGFGSQAREAFDNAAKRVNEWRGIAHPPAPVVRTSIGDTPAPQSTDGGEGEPTSEVSSSPIRDHVVREAVNAATKVAREYHATQQLRCRMVDALTPLIKAARGVSRLDSEVKRTPAPLVSGDSEANKEKG